MKMKKTLMLAALFAVGLLVTSCGGGTSEADQVKDFALDFATKVSNNHYACSSHPPASGIVRSGTLFINN